MQVFGKLMGVGGRPCATERQRQKQEIVLGTKILMLLVFCSTPRHSQPETPSGHLGYQV